MQSFMLNNSRLLWRQHYLRFALKQEVPLAPLNCVVFRKFSVQFSSSKTEKLNNLISPGCSFRSNVLQSQLKVTPFANSKRLLSILPAVAAVQSNDSSQSIIDLTTGSNQELIQSISQPLTEVSVSALKLGSNFTPIGWCVHFMDFLHSALPWWGTIALATLVLRLVMFPVVVIGQRTSVKLNEILPEQAILKEKMNQARLVGDSMEFARLANESHTLFKRRNVQPLKAMLTPLASAPVFLTFFLTLRRMANYPVESLKTGGFGWVTDLSIPDPLYVLPIVTGVTLWISLEYSLRAGLNPNQTVMIKYGARILPFAIIAFTYDFPSAILVYWCTSNILSIIQVVMLKQPAVRDFLNIPQIKVNPLTLEVNKKSFKKHFSETMQNAKINKLMEERKTIDDMSFKKAGIGPLRKTYKSDPTQVGNNS